ncbi:MAG: glucose-6-phosphate dehydrogenase [Gemmatimonadetes bacterium]|nr:glucose-6-phosphate dehydrogenase [Gemmatimonadota bacterium]
MGRGRVEPHAFIIFGATGDLARRKLLPALYHLSMAGALPPECRFLGVARTNMDEPAFRRLARDVLKQVRAGPGEDARRWCEDCLFYEQVAAEGPEGFQALARRVRGLEEETGLPGNRIFYLAVPPKAFGPVIEGLGEVGLNRDGGWKRLVVEKPVGHDLESARELNRLTHRTFDETQVYRIDHYLGKETVQNLLVFRFDNPIFEALWNRDHVESIQITVAETGGIDGRAGYYDGVGALRDMVQNHLTQVLSLVAMEVPAHFEADDIRNEKVKVVHSIAPVRPEDVVFGQYVRGRVEGDEVPGYRDEEGVPRDSRTETFVALRLEVANWRWQGVPFYLRTGKRTAQGVSQVVVTFHRPPVALLERFESRPLRSNVLVVTLQPDEGFDLFFHVKMPGQALRLEAENLHFRYSEAFAQRIPDAYETLLLDVMEGDQSLFVRADWVEASWKLYTPLLGAGIPVHDYSAGSWGPPEADRLLPAGMSWWNDGGAARGG